MNLCTEDLCIKMNGLKVDDDGITPIEKFSVTTTDITIKKITHVSV